MTTAAEPRLASLPLPGGREGASVRLHPLLTAELPGPPAWFLREEGRLGALHALGARVKREDYLRIPIVCFLVEHPSAGAIMIDTGFHASVAVDPKQNLGRMGSMLFRGIKMRPADAATDQLRSRGVEPTAVKTVLMTHLHVDHASAISEFPQATFLVSNAEWEAAAGGSGFRRGYHARQFDHAFDYRLLDFEGADTSSYASFGRTFDVFGDGSVRCVYTPGHTLGHMSVVLRTSGREVLVAGDAIYTLRTLRDTHLPWLMVDAHLFKRSLREIQLYAEQRPDALIIPGHDMEAWQALEPFYE